mgnify:CR=1 FL=1
MVMDKLSIIVRYGHIFLERKLKDYNLGFSEQIILMYLAKESNINQDAIAKHYMLDKGAIAKTVTKLEGKNLIKRVQNPDNRRENLLALSPQGAAIIDYLSTGLEEWNNTIYKGLTDEDIKELHRITNIMISNVTESIEGGNYGHNKN